MARVIKRCTTADLRYHTYEKKPITTTSLRRSDDDIRQFEAPSSLAQDLQQVLVDLVELHLQGKQAHWNVIGTNFRDLHLQLDEIVDIAREASDTIAERMRALNAVPDGRSDTVAAFTTLPGVPARRTEHHRDLRDLVLHTAMGLTTLILMVSMPGVVTDLSGNDTVRFCGILDVKPPDRPAATANCR